MNGAESLLRSLIASGVDVCFANPGTSEMHFVAALDAVEGMHPVLGLYEGVVTGAADGYGRMAGKPACTLLHLGPGLANGLANLHNARKASTPIVNIVGDHAATHARYDAPLSSDVIGFARPVSHWVHSSSSSRTAGADAARAVHAARSGAGQIATLILPADTAWEEADFVAPPLPAPVRQLATQNAVDHAARLLRNGKKTVILTRGEALQDRGLRALGKIAAQTGCRIMCDTFFPRLQRGAGRIELERLPYFAEQVVDVLAGTEQMILVGAPPPVSFFAYLDKPSWLTPAGCQLAVLAHPHEDGPASLEALLHALGAHNETARVLERKPIGVKNANVLDAQAIMQAVAKHLPENAIVADESLSSGFMHYGVTASALPHDYLNLTGGAIGSMMAVSTGAGIACPDRKVVTLQGDGSAMYILQSLWTQAREKVDVTTVIYANRGYKILSNELKRVGATNEGALAASMFDLQNPSLDWVRLATGMGVEAVSVDSPRAFEDAFADAMRKRGPRLIEALI
ncbi:MULTISPECIES: acetolactate synthase large subunit [Burkholderiaceae]|uniref:acetolactate synthase large subunit n=1 Tax=Burkholderiaceae TaxID=119060 RepID=UPI0014226BC3|nr:MULTISPECIES: acetolactate synthase large subunit [Burkholderiaceae]MBN3848868.1 acetolactate synthase large subunit [Paraburkholderia sp. Ac-20342]NIF50945.1 acetolactate synthase large subunit [Burkholderia sp. Ax-1724]NIF80789.1 acetolactate synthase large subunit [Paraburkholderia sp. Cy-641]